jgi:hypothetical protein
LVNGVQLYLSPLYQVKVTVTNSVSIVPHFGPSSQGDPGFVAYMAQFNLKAGAEGQHTYDDPDHDGLSNIQEYNLSNTNKGYYFNPASSDTDGDGMDDAYEAASIDSTNLSDSAKSTYRPAATDPGAGFSHAVPWGNGAKTISGADKNKGPEGNPDGDYHWSTTSGYMMPDQPLMNLEEYVGPDGIPPWTNILLTSADFPFTYNGVTISNYPFAANPAGSQPNIVVRFPYPGDTGDQSQGNTDNSDNDVFDDGYEYSWDQWQHWGHTNVLFLDGGTNEIILAGVVNQVPVWITNTVPDWASARVFNPGKTDNVGDGPDKDILYDYKSGKVSLLYYSADREYNAWQPTAFSPTVSGAPHSIRMDEPPTMPAGMLPRRSSHPFLWDVDRDGLPDGYEVIFGYDPWNPLTPGSVKSDGQDNPDQDYMAWSGKNTDGAAAAAGLAFALRNFEVYSASGFCPYVAVAQLVPKSGDMPSGVGGTNSPTTAPYSNVDEMRGPDGVMALTPSAPLSNLDDATSPINYDSDGDGIWDGSILIKTN